MKIAYDAKRFFQNNSGLGNYSRDLVRILATHFTENKYLLINKKQTGKGKEIIDLANVNFKNSGNAKLSRQLKSGIVAQDWGADIFHGLSGELPLKWNKKPIKKIVTIHDLIFERFPEYYSWFDRKIHFWKFKKAAEQADIVIAISEQTKRDIIQYLKIDENKIRVVYQACHQSFKKEISEETLNSIKQKYNLPEKFVLNVGTIEARKNLKNLVIALANTEIPLVVVGKKQKKYAQLIEKIIAKNKVNVQFLEAVSMDELSGIYRLATMMVYPSFFEGFGIPIIEAGFSKTPIITSNVSSLPEAGGSDTLYINPEDTSDIQSKILFLWNNESERKRRAEKTFEYVQKFNDDIIAQNLMKLYKNVLKLN